MWFRDSEASYCTNLVGRAAHVAKPHGPPFLQRHVFKASQGQAPPGTRRYVVFAIRNWLTRALTLSPRILQHEQIRL